MTVLTSRQRPGTLTLPLVSSLAELSQGHDRQATVLRDTGRGQGRPGPDPMDPRAEAATSRPSPAPLAQGGGAAAGAESGAQAANAFSADQASSLPDTGSPRWLLAALALGLALLMAGSLLVLGQRVRSQ